MERADLQTPSQATSGRVDRWVMMILALAAASGIAWLWTAPVVDLTFRSTDDSYYYFNVARNVVLGRGSSFDGINPTNGYHPLGMLIILPVFALTGAGPEPGLRAVFSLVAVLVGVAGWLACRTAARSAGPAAGLVAVLVLSFPVFLDPLLCGLEPAPLALLLFSLLLASQRWDLLAPEAGGRKDALLGALLAAVFLARLDSVFIVLAIFGAIVARWAAAWARPSSGLPLPLHDPHAAGKLLVKLVRVGAVAAALVLPYFLWNQLAFGHLMPINCGLKSSFPHPNFSLSSLMGLRALGAGQLALSALALLVLWSQSRWRQAGPGTASRVAVPAILPAMWVGSAIHLVHSLVFTRAGDALAIWELKRVRVVDDASQLR